MIWKTTSRHGLSVCSALSEIDWQTHLLQPIFQRRALLHSVLALVAWQQLSQRGSLRTRQQLLIVQSLLSQLLLQCRDGAFQKTLLISSMTDGHALVVGQELEHATILDQRGIHLLVVGIVGQLALHGLDDSEQGRGFVGGRDGSGIIEGLQWLAARIFRRHLHQPQVLQHFQGVTIGVARKVDHGIAPDGSQELDLLFRERVDRDGLIRQRLDEGFRARRDSDGDIDGVERIALHGESVQEKQLGVGLGSVGNVDLLHAAVSTVGVQDDLVEAAGEEPVASLARVDVGLREWGVVDEVGVRDHGEGLSRFETSQTDGT
mmetsp:Transcript_6022/g.16383  ORF Transcript_6022/g.16383 Transcript_6022/m.16383 type:complete len:319 (-) Transcript_6022:179-1135(-)